MEDYFSHKIINVYIKKYGLTGDTVIVETGGGGVIEYATYDTIIVHSYYGGRHIIMAHDFVDRFSKTNDAWYTRQ